MGEKADFDTYLLPYDSWDFSEPFFIFDAELIETRDDTWKASKYAIEGGAEISDFLVKEPRVYNLTGIVSGWYASTDDEVWTRVTDAHAALVEYADTRQPLTAVCGLWVDELIITGVSAKRDSELGDAAEISITLQSFEIAEYTEVEIPAELLAPAVKADATTEEAAGEAADQEVDSEDAGDAPAAKSAAAGIADGDNPADIFAGLGDRYT